MPWKTDSFNIKNYFNRKVTQGNDRICWGMFRVFTKLTGKMNSINQPGLQPSICFNIIRTKCSVYSKLKPLKSIIFFKSVVQELMMYLFIGFKFYLKDFLAPRLFKTMNEKFNFSCFSYHKCFDTPSAGLCLVKIVIKSLL